MPKSIFISYVYEDKAHRKSVERWFDENLAGDDRVSIAESEDYRQLGESAIKNYLKPKLRGCAAVLCLVGDDTHNSHWVQYELDVATSLNKQIVLARVPNTRGAAPTRHRSLNIHVLDPSTLRKLFR
ncbi:TIR domain-containing protein [Enhygromyxa salina]|nr:TIR domain-containing protein [Enhygromyxa salina]